MSNDDATLYPLPFAPLASIVPPPAGLPGPPSPPPVDLRAAIAEVTLDHLAAALDTQDLEEAQQSFEIPGVLPLDNTEQETAKESPVSSEPGPEPAPQPQPKPRRPPILDPIPGLMNARETHMLSGSSGAGKTSWLGWFISQLLTADTIFDRPVQKPPFIVYLAGDRSLRDAEDKFIRAGWLEPVTWGIVESANHKVDAQLKATADGSSNESRAFPMFRDALEDIARIHKLPGNALPADSLVIIDSMSTILGIEPSGSYLRNVAAPLAMLNRYCRNARITVLLVHHGGKQMADKTQRYARAQDRILGSMALLGFTSTQFQLTEPELTGDPTQGLHELTVVSHSAKAFGLYFERSQDTGAFQPMAGSLPAPGARESDDAAALQAYIKEVPTRGIKARILEALRSVPDDSAASVPELQDRLGCKEKGKRSNFFKAIRDLIDDGFLEEVIDSTNGRWVKLKSTGVAS